MAPRVLIVSRARWPRALLRAQLRERGYDAVAAPSLTAALPYVSGRKPVHPKLILVEHQLVSGDDAEANLARLADGVAPAVVLFAGAHDDVPEGDWAAVLRRPLDLAEVLRTVQRLLPARSAAAE